MMWPTADPKTSYLDRGEMASSQSQKSTPAIIHSGRISNMLENFNIVLAQKRGGQKDIAKAAMHYALLVYPYFFLFCSKCLGFASLGFGKMVAPMSGRRILACPLASMWTWQDKQCVIAQLYFVTQRESEDQQAVGNSTDLTGCRIIHSYAVRVFILWSRKPLPSKVSSKSGLCQSFHG